MRTLIRARHVLGFERDGTTCCTEMQKSFTKKTALCTSGTAGVEPPTEDSDAGNALVAPGFIDLDVGVPDHALAHWASQDVRKGHQWLSRTSGAGVTTSSPWRSVSSFANTLSSSCCATASRRVCQSRPKRLVWADAGRIRGHGQRLADSACERTLARATGGVNVVRDDGTRDVMWDPSEGERSLGRCPAISGVPGATNRRLSCGPPCYHVVVPRHSEISKVTAVAAEQVSRSGCTACRTPLRWRSSGVSTGARSWSCSSRQGCYPVSCCCRTAPIWGKGKPRDSARLFREAEPAGRGRSIHRPLSFDFDPARGRSNSFDRYRAAGVNMALGSDSYPPD